MASTFALTSVSGIDINSMIDSLVGIEQNKVTRVETEMAGYQVKIDAYGKLRSLLSDIKQKAADLSKTTSFDLFSATSTDEKAISIAGGSGAVDGQYQVNVFQLAANEKMISANGRLTSQSATLASQGITVGDISIGGVTISIDDNDTIQDLRSKINNATDAKGKKLGITASVLKVADNNFRLVISAKESGSTGVTYQDSSGSTLQDLGIITNATGDKGNVNQIIQSSSDIVAAFNALGTGETVTYAGTDHAGRAVSNTFIKSAESTIDDFTKQVAATFHGAADVTTDAGGNLILSDKIAGSSRMTVSAMTIGAADHTMSISQVGAEGAGVLSVGKDAYYSIEGLFMQSATNTVSEFVTGVTFSFLAVAPEESVTVGLSRDFDSIQKKFKDLLDSYNALSSYARDATKTADPNNKNSSDGDLAGDMTVRSIVNAVRDTFRQQYDKLNHDLTTFTMIGLKSDSKTGELSLDEKKFKSATEKDLNAVQQLFVTMGVSDNANVTLGRSTKETKAGRYVLEEIDPTHIRMRQENGTEWYTSDARLGDIVTFGAGPAKGLSLSAASGVMTGPVTFNFQKGLSTVLDEAIAKLTDTREGVVSLRQTALEKSIERANDRIDTLNTRTEKYRDRLVRQFSAMETALSGLQQQSGRITSMFGN